MFVDFLRRLKRLVVGDLTLFIVFLGLAIFVEGIDTFGEGELNRCRRDIDRIESFD